MYYFLSYKILDFGGYGEVLIFVMYKRQNIIVVYIVLVFIISGELRYVLFKIVKNIGEGTVKKICQLGSYYTLIKLYFNEIFFTRFHFKL